MKPPVNPSTPAGPDAGWWGRFRRRRTAMGSLAVLGLLAFAALLAPALVSQAPDLQQVAEALQAPSSRHWMGTDELGRDLFSRLLHGARISLAVALATGFLSLILGALWGSISGYRGGRLDNLMMRIVDAVTSFPDLLVVILVMEFLKRFGDTGLLGIVAALSLTGWAAVARVVRGEVLRLRELAYIESARALGLAQARILWRHILPNTVGTLAVLLTYRIPVVILAESTLSFLGLGIRPPYASWGTLANDGWVAMRFHPHLILFPSAAVFITVFTFYLLGDALREALAPDRRNVRTAG